MGLVISSVVAGGPAVLEDLETPYAVILERRRKQAEIQSQKPRLRRQKKQLQFERSSSRQVELRACETVGGCKVRNGNGGDPRHERSDGNLS